MHIDLTTLVGVEPADAACLHAMKPDMERKQSGIINAFYERILTFPAFKKMLEDTCTDKSISLDQLVGHISSVQFAHWGRFFDGTPDEEFQKGARQIGIVHEKCLLTNDLYVASSAVLLEKFLALATEHHLGEDPRATALKTSLGALVRLFFLDLSLAISAYDHAAARTSFRQASEPLLKAFEGEMTQDLESMSSAAKELDGTIRSVVDLNRGNMQRCQETVLSIETLAGNLDELGRITEHIENFVKVITDVSRKTKLLALNAAIEAARSGEFGRGFNVVASEVKALANEAEEATRRVTIQAGEIHAAIRAALTQIEGSQKLVQAIDQGVATESRAIAQQSAAVDEISSNLAAVLSAVSESTRSLRERFKTLSVA
ncbi:MAG: chemotaxis protein [Rhizobiales bacterium 62-47]|nr:globin-coupled sensor protein [Hyphomicrobiales bacterium]OJY08971.1 MAG: chemotaxis protein [Rhizobiales bacterium 62-47]